MTYRSMVKSALTALTCMLVLGGVTACNDNNGPHYSADCGTQPWCNTNLSADQRADLLLQKLQRKEKFELMSVVGVDVFSAIPAIQRLGVPPLKVVDGAAGISLKNNWTGNGADPSVAPPSSDPDVPAGKNTATALPAPIALAAAWDTDLARRYGTAIGEEASALNYDSVFGPNVNIMRTPLGGRTFEAYGEDPELSARMGVAWIQGLQSQDIIATVKHYAGNNQEHHRFSINANIDERTLREIYLPAFHAAVKHAHTGSIMEAYNSVNGERMTQNKHLLLDVLKTEWGFKGYAITDAVAAQRTTVASANAGNDVELPRNHYAPPKLAKAVDAGKISMKSINNHVHRVLRTEFAFGMFDRPHSPHPNRGSIPHSMRKKHAVLSRTVEESAITLLKNDGQALPLNARKLHNIAVIGSMAKRYKAGLGSSYVTPFYAVTPLRGIRNRVANLPAQVSYYDGDDHSVAAQKAASADVAIVVVADFEAEGGDRPCMKLDCQPTPGLKKDAFKPFPDFPQNGLISAVAAQQPNTIVVVEAGAPVLMPWIDSVPAVLYAYYPGEEGGNAIASVLFGDVNPSGHLPFTIPVKESDLSTYNSPQQYPGVNNDETYSEGIFVGYRHYDESGIKPLFPFGYGLSYTHFKLSGLNYQLSPSGGTVSAYVTNTGNRPGAQVVQLYLGLPDTKAPEPPKWLRDFTKVKLAPGEAKRLTFDVSPRDLSYWSVQQHGWEVAPGCYRVMVGTSSRDIPLSGKTCFDENG